MPVVLHATLLAALLAGAAGPSPAAAPGSAGTAPTAGPTSLSFDDLVDRARPGSSPRARELAGQRVRLVGFMVDMEDPPRGAFFLARRPVHCDEGGAGTGDLPPDAVRVVVRSTPTEAIPFRPGALEVSGVLSLGYQSDADGRVSHYQLVLDGPADLATPPRS